MGKRELVALLNLSTWCLVMVERLFLALPHGCLRFVIVFFPDHTHLLFFLSLRCTSVCKGETIPSDVYKHHICVSYQILQMQYIPEEVIKGFQK